jgi:hypothetical protein
MGGFQPGPLARMRVPDGEGRQKAIYYAGNSFSLSFGNNAEWQPILVIHEFVKSLPIADTNEGIFLQFEVIRVTWYSVSSEIT